MSDTAQAVSFAAWLIREKGEYRTKAINAAAKKYSVPRAEVQSGLSRRSGKSQTGKPKPTLRHKPITREEQAAALAWIDNDIKGPNRYELTPGMEAELSRIRATIATKCAISDSQLKRLRNIANYSEFQRDDLW